MPGGLRNAIAHAASPWDWRSDVAVWALVVIMCALPIATMLAGLLRALSGDGIAALITAVPMAALYYLLFARPAIRSLRKRQSLVAARTSV
jgi:hypothetical protein